jgi:hypothetical protein
MASSQAATIEDYQKEMEPERAREFAAVLELIRRNLPEGYEEGMAWGMAGWWVPLEVYPDTYNKQPLMAVALANQKNYLSLYLNTMYASPELKKIVDESGRKLKMGKSCINFKSREELPIEEIGEVLRRSDRETYVALAKAAAAAKQAREPAKQGAS